MGSIRQGCLGIRQASSQWKTFFLTLGHFCGYESKLVCFISTIGKKKTHSGCGNVTQHKNTFAMEKKKAIKAHPEENIFPLNFFNFVFPNLGLPHSTNSCLCQKLYVM
jgi:hypothetical protein